MRLNPWAGVLPLLTCIPMHIDPFLHQKSGSCTKTRDRPGRSAIKRDRGLVRTRPDEDGQPAAFVSNLEIGTLKVHRLVYTPVAGRRRAGNYAGPFQINLCAVLLEEPIAMRTVR
jgi:hypothetical protein